MEWSPSVGGYWLHNIGWFLDILQVPIANKWRLVGDFNGFHPQSFMKNPTLQLGELHFLRIIFWAASDFQGVSHHMGFQYVPICSYDKHIIYIINIIFPSKKTSKSTHPPVLSTEIHRNPSVTSTKSAAPHRGLTAVIWWTMVSPGASLTPSCDLDWTWMTWRHAPETFKFDGFYHLVMTNLT